MWYESRRIMNNLVIVYFNCFRDGRVWENILIHDLQDIVKAENRGGNCTCRSDCQFRAAVERLIGKVCARNSRSNKRVDEDVDKEVFICT